MVGHMLSNPAHVARPATPTPPRISAIISTDSKRAGCFTRLAEEIFLPNAPPEQLPQGSRSDILRNVSSHGKPVRTTTVYRSRRPHSRRQEHTVQSDRRDAARATHQRT